MTVGVTATVTIPSGTGIELTVHEDETADDPPVADISQTLTLADGTQTYSYDQLTGRGRRYWWTADFTNSEDTWDVTPQLHAVEIEANTNIDPIGYQSIAANGEVYRVPAYPRGSPTPDLVHGKTDEGEPASLNIVPPTDSPITFSYGGETHAVAIEHLLVGPEPQPEIPEEDYELTIIDSFERSCLYEYEGATSRFNPEWTKKATHGKRALEMDYSPGRCRVFSAPGDGLNYYPQVGDTITWDFYSKDKLAHEFYFGGDSVDACYGIALRDESMWLYTRRNGEFDDEIRYNEYIRDIHDAWMTHTLSWQYNAELDQIEFDYQIVRKSDGRTVGGLVGVDPAVCYTEGGIGYGVYSGNRDTWIDYVRIEPGDRHDQP